MKLFLTLFTGIFGLFSLAQTFSLQNSGVSSQLNALSFSSTSTGIVVGNSGVIRKTTDSGLTWTASSSGVMNDLSGVAFLNGSTYIAVGKTGTIIRTTNAGSSWSVVNSGTTNDLTSIYVNGLNIYVTGANGTVLISTNSGSAWTSINTGTSFKLNKTCFVSEYVGYAVGEGGTILKTVNGGQAWNFLTSGTSTHSLTDIYFTNSNTGVITGANNAANEGIILRTTNAGSSWTSDNFSTAILSGVDFYPDNSVGYAVGGSITGNTSRILKTTGQGASWSPVVSSFSRQLAVCFPGNGIGYSCGLNGSILRLATNTAGMEEQTERLDIRVSPNPGKGIFTVSSNSNEAFSIEIYSPDGKQLEHFENTHTIDLSIYPAGMYQATIYTGSGIVQRKLIKE